MTVRTRRPNLGEEAYDRLRALLLDGGRYAPGDKVNVIAVAQELGVSRSPVWDAIARLESEGLLEVVPRHGVFLVRFDARRLAELYETREALEGMAARLAAERAGLADVAELERSLAAQQARLDAGDTAGYADAALAFHQAVLRIAGNETIARMLDALYAQTRTMCRGLPTRPGELPARRDDHAHLVAAIRDRDMDRAEAVARVHVRSLALAARCFPGKPASQGDAP
ncbi:GntR family transcriptional regulator [Azospirillum rugosum]|uniref:DNA-binding GntR family transcriptional regulator n=1 Tax=Azospirillum rugosum TaxID=416170 RepID=A0ABS4SIM9_9PROT|nr:GntR family transcriptional regulator [Azospirillum rugosum]MBP2291265.1 DNA-binding GntR family transcriptional regulator [Azospirillum rugosum]MDQ0525053.1 DNA-binding GntR family transcriptional regulator [Azospirillum rugosum]